MAFPYVKQILAEYAKLVKEYETIASSLATEMPESNPEFGLGKLTDAINSIRNQWLKLVDDVSNASFPCVLLSSIGLSNIRSVLREIVQHALTPVLQSGPQYSGPEQIPAWKNFTETNLTDVLFCSDSDPIVINMQKRYVMDAIQNFSNLIHGDSSIKQLKTIQDKLFLYIKETIKYRKSIVESVVTKTIEFSDIVQICKNYHDNIVNLASGEVGEYHEYRFQAQIEAEVYNSFVLLADCMSHTNVRNIQTSKRRLAIKDRINRFLKSFDGIHLVGEDRTYRPGDDWKTKMRQIIPMYLSCIPYKVTKDNIDEIKQFRAETTNWLSDLNKVYTRGSQTRENDINEIKAALSVIGTGKRPANPDEAKSGFEKLLNIVKRQLNSTGSKSLDKPLDDAIQNFKSLRFGP